MSVQLDVITYEIELDILTSGEVTVNMIDGITVYDAGSKVSTTRALDFRGATVTKDGNRVRIEISGGAGDLQEAYDNGTGIITLSTGKPFDVVADGGLTNLRVRDSSTRISLTSAQGILFVAITGGIGSTAQTTQEIIAGTTMTLQAGTGITSTGSKHSFTPAAGYAGINVGSLAGNPSSLANGDLWYNSSSNELNARINGATVALGAGGGGWATTGTTTMTGNVTTAFGTNTWAITSAATTGTFATLSSSTLSSGTAFMVDITGTVALTDNKGLYVKQSGVNATGSQSTFGGYFQNIRTGAGNNYALFATASGGTNNYSGIFENGNFGIGITAPTELFHVNSSTSHLKYRPANNTLSILGPVTNLTLMPRVNFGFNSDADAAISFLNYDHDNLAITFDAWHNGTTWVSSHAGSNFALYKNSDHLYIGYNAGTAKASTFSAFVGGVFFNKTGYLGIGVQPTVPLHVSGNATTTGVTAYVSSTSLTTGTLFKAESTSTAINHTAGTSALISAVGSGANSTSGKTIVGIQSVVSNTGTSSVNYAAYLSASGATGNYALATNGTVLINRTSPANGSSVLDMSISASFATIAVSLTNAANAGARTFAFDAGGILFLGSGGQYISPGYNGTSLTYTSSGTGAGTATNHIFSSVNALNAAAAGPAFVSFVTTFTTASGNPSRLLELTPTWNTAGSTGSDIGVYYNPTNTSHGSSSHYAWKSTSGSFDITQGASTVSWTPVIKTTPGAHTGLTAATEFVSSDFLGATQTWADGTVATQRFAYFRAFTLNKTTTAAVFTDTYRGYFEKSIAGTGVTLTRNWGIGTDGNLQVQGSIYVGAASVLPTALLHIAAGVTGNAQINLSPGVAPSAPVDGDIYYINTNDRLMFFKNATASEILAASAANAVSPTAPDRTLTIVHNGVTLYIHAKTTND